MIDELLQALLPVVAVVGGLVLAVLGGSPVTVWVFHRAERHHHGPRPEGGAPPREGVISAAADTLRGGTAIGYLERAATFLAIVSGYPEGIALVVAIKGLGRYGELKGDTVGTAERFIIGTLTSLVFACVVAAAARWLVDLGETPWVALGR